MSSKDLGHREIEQFVGRFVEVCGSDQPKKVAQMLNVSYQAARNYLDGRLPEARVLRSIAERTPYSINWLLTGEGDKFVRNVSAADDGLRLTEPMRTVIRQVCLEIFAEFVGSAEKSSEPKIIKLTADKIKEETLLREPAFHPESDR